MFYCNECKHEFEEPKTIYEWHSELNGMGGNKCEEFTVCPICESDDFEEEDVCDFCNDPRPKTIEVGRRCICESCLDEISSGLIYMRNTMHETYKFKYSECEGIIQDIAEVIWG